jgi:hypothetical protein
MRLLTSVHECIHLCTNNVRSIYRQISQLPQNYGVSYSEMWKTRWYQKLFFFFNFWRNSPQLAMASSFTRFLDHTQRHTTVGRTPVDGWPARRSDLYLTTHNTHNRQTSMPSVGFETTMSAGERPQTYALDRAATGTGKSLSKGKIIGVCFPF